MFSTAVCEKEDAGEKGKDLGSVKYSENKLLKKWQE